MKYRHVKHARAQIENLCEKEEGIMKAEKSVYKVSRSYDRFARKLSEKITYSHRTHFGKNKQPVKPLL